jgi:hypothetical protein
MVGAGSGDDVRFARRTSGQFIVTYFTFIATSRPGTVPWDLTTTTGTDAQVEAPVDNRRIFYDDGDYGQYPPDGNIANPNPRMPFIIPNYRTPAQWVPPGTTEKALQIKATHGLTGISLNLAIPIVVFDYSDDSSSDAHLVGTH